jgi:hypothetical protein
MREKEDMILKTLNLPQCHSLNTLRHTLTGISKGRSSQKIVVETNEFSDTVSAVQTNKESFRTEIRIDDFSSLKNNLNNEKVSKLLDLIFYFLNRDGLKNRVEFSVREYIEYTGRKMTTSNIKDITRNELKKLLSILIKFSISGKEGTNNYSFIRPFVKTEIQYGRIIIELNNIFLENIGKRFFTIPYNVGRLNSTAYYISTYIYLYAAQTGKKNFNLSCGVLFDYSGMPRYREVVEKCGGSISQKIIIPFFKSLQEIVEVLGSQIQITYDNQKINSWKDFEQLKLHIETPLITVKKRNKTNKKEKGDDQTDPKR